MNSKEFGFVLIFIGALGLSNYFVNKMKFKRASFIFYNIFILSLGFGLMNNVFKISPNINLLLGR
jgi:sulfite exporter TauE/SafE